MQIKQVATCLALCAVATLGLGTAQASAQPLLEDFFGGRLKGGALVESTNEGNIVLSSSIGNIICQESTLTGTVDANVVGFNITITKATFAGEAANTHCTSTIIFNPTFTVDTAESLPWCLTNEGNADDWTVRGGGCKEAAKNLTFTLTGAFTCRYTRATVTGTFNTTISPATFKIGAGQTFTKEESSSGVCPASGTLSGAWELYTDVSPTTHDGSTAVTIHDGEVRWGAPHWGRTARPQSQLGL